MPLGIEKKPYRVAAGEAMWGEQKSYLGWDLGSAFYYPCDLERFVSAVKWA